MSMLKVAQLTSSVSKILQRIPTTLGLLLRDYGTEEKSLEIQKMIQTQLLLRKLRTLVALSL